MMEKLKTGSSVLRIVEADSLEKEQYKVCAVIVQSMFRGFHSRKMLKLHTQCAVTIQKYFRDFTVRCCVPWEAPTSYSPKNAVEEPSSLFLCEVANQSLREAEPLHGRTKNSNLVCTVGLGFGGIYGGIMKFCVTHNHSRNRNGHSN